MVLVDTDVIAKALAKPLMAEMGDTIARPILKHVPAEPPAEAIKWQGSRRWL